jgi:hypothetical protein
VELRFFLEERKAGDAKAAATIWSTELMCETAAGTGLVMCDLFSGLVVIVLAKISSASLWFRTSCSAESRGSCQQAVGRGRKHEVSSSRWNCCSLLLETTFEEICLNPTWKSFDLRFPSFVLQFCLTLFLVQGWCRFVFKSAWRLLS